MTIMPELPLEIINYIFLFMEHPAAKLIKDLPTAKFVRMTDGYCKAPTHFCAGNCKIWWCGINIGHRKKSKFSYYEKRLLIWR